MSDLDVTQMLADPNFAGSRFLKMNGPVTFLAALTMQLIMKFD
ncbi:MAG: hypothetical protein NTW21_14840 [Verrucomicrobia bacterium]|nr:hypothetical protein [Verrucomicrobiota bacterium]